MLDTTSDYEQHFTGDGINKTFSVSFVVFREEDVVVLIDGAPYGYSFTVLGVGSHSGFSVTLATVPAIGMDVAVLSRPELIRDTDYQLNGDILAEELNRDLDRLWQGLQITDAVVQEAQENAANSESAATASAASAAASASSASSAAASAAALSTLQAGTPTDVAIAAGNTVQDALWKLQGQANAKLEYKYSGNWAGRPDPATLPGGSLIHVNEYPTLLESIFISSQIGLYFPASGNFFIGSTDSPSDSDLSGDEQILTQYQTLTDYLIVGLPLVANFGFAKSGSTDSATFRIRVGAVGDLTDPVIATYTMSAAELSYPNISALMYTTASTIQCAMSQSGVPSTDPYPAPVTIPNITTDSVYISFTVEMSGTTDAGTVMSSYVIQRGFG